MHHLSWEQLKALLKSIPDAEDRLMILVGFHHGLRVSEIIGLTGKNVRDGFVTVQRLKGSAKTTQPFIKHPDPLLDEYDALMKKAVTLKANQRLFPITRFGVYKLMQRAGKRAGIPQHLCHPHVLKHSIAMLSINKAGVHVLKVHLGHQSLSSTGAYLKLSEEAASRAMGAAIGAASELATVGA